MQFLGKDQGEPYRSGLTAIGEKLLRGCLPNSVRLFLWAAPAVGYIYTISEFREHLIPATLSVIGLYAWAAINTVKRRN